MKTNKIPKTGVYILKKRKGDLGVEIMTSSGIAVQFMYPIFSVQKNEIKRFSYDKVIFNRNYSSLNEFTKFFGKTFVGYTLSAWRNVEFVFDEESKAKTIIIKGMLKL